jgi:hypothetical protein
MNLSKAMTSNGSESALDTCARFVHWLRGEGASDHTRRVALTVGGAFIRQLKARGGSPLGVDLKNVDIIAAFEDENRRLSASGQHISREEFALPGLLLSWFARQPRSIQA